MDLIKTIHNTKQRFNLVESKSNGQIIKNDFKMLLKSSIRGGLVGSLVGYIIGGDLDSAEMGGIIGFGLDNIQSTWRCFSLGNMYRKNPEEYTAQKNKYIEAGWM